MRNFLRRAGARRSRKPDRADTASIRNLTEKCPLSAWDRLKHRSIAMRDTKKARHKMRSDFRKAGFRTRGTNRSIA